tara:strand:- start:209 stop:694 length:486 start_codon:yes stop_codon:yes gene_type:complete
MTTSNYITFILLGVIGLVFLIDFILNSKKKPLEKSVEKFVEKEKGEGKSSFKWLNWILDRKKNFTLSILIISLLKLLVHFFLYREIPPYFRKYFSSEIEPLSEWEINHNQLVQQKNEYYSGCEEFSWHLEKIYIETIWLFIPVTIIFLIVVWFFNDKIKAR